MSIWLLLESLGLGDITYYLCLDVEFDQAWHHLGLLVGWILLKFHCALHWHNRLKFSIHNWHFLSWSFMVSLLQCHLSDIQALLRECVLHFFENVKSNLAFKPIWWVWSVEHCSLPALWQHFIAPPRNSSLTPSLNLAHAWNDSSGQGHHCSII